MMLCPRCRQEMERPVYQAGPLVYDPHRHELSIDGGEPIKLRTQTGAVLRNLMQNPGHFATLDALVGSAVGEGCSPRAIHNAVHRLRKQLGEHRNMIRNLWGTGYVLDVPQQPEVHT